MFHIFTNKNPSEFGRAQHKLLTQMKVRVAIIQEGPVWMDLGATLLFRERWESSREFEKTRSASQGGRERRSAACQAAPFQTLIPRRCP
jgi:hypothetical protein